jgi:hypothetical protein
MTAGVAGALVAGAWLLPQEPSQWVTASMFAGAGAGILLARLALRLWDRDSRRPDAGAAPLQLGARPQAAPTASGSPDDEWYSSRPSRQRRGGPRWQLQENDA